MSRVYPTRQCATPGCDRPLVWRSPHPVCPICREEPPAPPRPGTRRAIVSVSTTTSMFGSAAVTLPAEPWGGA